MQWGILHVFKIPLFDIETGNANVYFVLITIVLENFYRLGMCSDNSDKQHCLDVL